MLRRLDALLADADPEAAAVLDRLGDADAAELLHRLADPDPAEVAALARLAKALAAGSVDLLFERYGGCPARSSPATLFRRKRRSAVLRQVDRLTV